MKTNPCLLKKFLSAGFLIVFLSPYGEAQAKNIEGKVEANSPIHFGTGEKNPVDNVEVLKEATDDYRAVVEGKRPVHAVVDKKAPLPADGGTTFYLGKGYRLTIQCSIVNFSNESFYFYGPIITFDKGVAVGESPTISHIEIYSPESLRKLLGK